jgi:hypothetical protein
MSTSLDASSSTDVTLTQNIANPPVSHAENNKQPSRSSFTHLHDNPPMANLGIDENVTKDDTLSRDSNRSRRPSEPGYQGLDAGEIKQAAMASWVGNIAQGDGTLIE